MELHELGQLVPADLLAALDEIFPHQCPRITTPERQIWHDAGVRSLVDFLHEARKRANETPPSTRSGSGSSSITLQ